MHFAVVARIVLRALGFLLCLFFLLFYIAYGLRYNSGSGEILAHTASLHFTSRSDSTSLQINQEKFNTIHHQLSLYNRSPGCYYVTYGGEESVYCLGREMNENDILITVDNIETNSEGTDLCENESIALTHTERCLVSDDAVGNCFSRPIDNALTARNILFVDVGSTLFACTQYGDKCRALGTIEGTLQCSTKKGLLYEYQNQFTEIKFS